MADHSNQWRFDPTYGGIFDGELLLAFFKKFQHQCPGPRHWYEVAEWYKAEVGAEHSRRVSRELEKLLRATKGESAIESALQGYQSDYYPNSGKRNWLTKVQRRLKRRPAPNR